MVLLVPWIQQCAPRDPNPPDAHSYGTPPDNLLQIPPRIGPWITHADFFDFVPPLPPLILIRDACVAAD